MSFYQKTKNNKEELALKKLKKHKKWNECGHVGDEQTNTKSISELQPAQESLRVSLNEGQNRLISHMCGLPSKVYRSGKVPLKLLQWNCLSMVDPKNRQNRPGFKDEIRRSALAAEMHDAGIVLAGDLNTTSISVVEPWSLITP